MYVLIDTNVFIPLEPAGPIELEVTSQPAAELLRFAQKHRINVLLHPMIRDEIAKDKDYDRARMRRFLMQKYPLLESAPELQEPFASKLGNPSEGSHDYVDAHLLAALDADAVDFLISEDIGLHRKARRAGLANRVLTIEEAISAFNRFYPDAGPPPAGLTRTEAHAIPKSDPILDSLRSDYPGFDQWLERARKEHRICWLIQDGPARPLRGLCIVKDESGNSERILKICTFKINDGYRGFKYGELLLYGVLEHARRARFDAVYLTVFPKHEELFLFLQEFGFQQTDIERTGEIRLSKCLTSQAMDPGSMDPLSFHIAFGPGIERLFDVDFFLIPIEPRFHALLFPYGQKEGDLFPGMLPYQNAIRKVYVCNASTRAIKAGDILLFYRSGDNQAIREIGVCEATFAARSGRELARFAGNRTVYSLDDLDKIAESNALAVRFRFSRSVPQEIKYHELLDNYVINGPIQSIQKIKPEHAPWIRNRIAE
jgi:GNAT superfamily N-acetyltransferase